MENNKEQESRVNIPEIVKNYVIDVCGRMPETEQEVNEYLDLILHSKEYAQAFEMEQALSKRMMKKLGFKTSAEIKLEFISNNNQ